jgi:hypothetical protein
VATTSNAEPTQRITDIAIIARVSRTRNYGSEYRGGYSSEVATSKSHGRLPRYILRPYHMRMTASMLTYDRLLWRHALYAPVGPPLTADGDSSVGSCLGARPAPAHRR